MYLYVTTVVPSASIVTVCVGGGVNPSYVLTGGVTVAPVFPTRSSLSASSYVPSSFSFSCITVYGVLSPSTQLAVYVLSPVDPVGIVTVIVFSLKSVPVHPSNTYPLLVGLINVISSLSTVYDVGFVPSTDPPFNT